MTKTANFLRLPTKSIPENFKISHTPFSSTTQLQSSTFDSASHGVCLLKWTRRVVQCNRVIKKGGSLAGSIPALYWGGPGLRFLSRARLSGFRIIGLYPFPKKVTDRLVTSDHNQSTNLPISWRYVSGGTLRVAEHAKVTCSYTLLIK